MDDVYVREALFGFHSALVDGGYSCFLAQQIFGRVYARYQIVSTNSRTTNIVASWFEQRFGSLRELTIIRRVSHPPFISHPQQPSSIAHPPPQTRHILYTPRPQTPHAMRTAQFSNANCSCGPCAIHSTGASREQTLFNGTGAVVTPLTLKLSGPMPIPLPIPKPMAPPRPMASPNNMIPTRNTFSSLIDQARSRQQVQQGPAPYIANPLFAHRQQMNPLFAHGQQMNRTSASTQTKVTALAMRDGTLSKGGSTRAPPKNGTPIDGTPPPHNACPPGGVCLSVSVRPPGVDESNMSDPSELLKSKNNDIGPSKLKTSNLSDLPEIQTHINCPSASNTNGPSELITSNPSESTISPSESTNGPSESTIEDEGPSNAKIRAIPAVNMPPFSIPKFIIQKTQTGYHKIITSQSEGAIVPRMKPAVIPLPTTIASNVLEESPSVPSPSSLPDTEDEDEEADGLITNIKIERASQ